MLNGELSCLYKSYKPEELGKQALFPVSAHTPMAEIQLSPVNCDILACLQQMAQANGIHIAEALEMMKKSLDLSDNVDLCNGDVVFEVLQTIGNDSTSQRRTLLAQADNLQVLRKGLVVLNTAMSLDALGEWSSSGFAKVCPPFESSQSSLRQDCRLRQSDSTVQFVSMVS